MLATGCGSQPQTDRPALTSERWRVEADRNRGFTVQLPSGWIRATGKLTSQITDPLEILTVATLPTADAGPYGNDGPQSRPALPAFTEKDALVTVHESGRGALRINRLSHPPRPDRLRPETFPYSSTFTDCLLATFLSRTIGSALPTPAERSTYW